MTAQRAVSVYAPISDRQGSFLGSASKERISTSSSPSVGLGQNLKFLGLEVQYRGNRDRPYRSKKKVVASGRMTTLTNLSLNLFYETAKGSNKTCPGRPAKESQEARRPG